MIDTHAHLAAVQFDGDRDTVIERAVAVGIKGVICVLSDLSRIHLFRQLLEGYDFMYGAAGIDPFSSRQLDELQGPLEGALALTKVVAIGEIGLDYYRPGSPSGLQKKAFRYQLGLARSMNLPVIVHCRDAFEDTMQLLGEFVGVDVIMHCFSGTLEQMRICTELGFYVSLAGVVTFPNARQLEDVCRAIPDERLLIETDCPYLAPQAVRGQRCEPAHLIHTLLEVARLRGQAVEALVRLTTDNACRVLRVNGTHMI